MERTKVSLATLSCGSFKIKRRLPAITCICSDIVNISKRILRRFEANPSPSSAVGPFATYRQNYYLQTLLLYVTRLLHYARALRTKIKRPRRCFMSFRVTPTLGECAPSRFRALTMSAFYGGFFLPGRETDRFTTADGFLSAFRFRDGKGVFGLYNSMRASYIHFTIDYNSYIIDIRRFFFKFLSFCPCGRYPDKRYDCSRFDSTWFGIYHL